MISRFSIVVAAFVLISLIGVYAIGQDDCPNGACPPSARRTPVRDAVEKFANAPARAWNGGSAGKSYGSAGKANGGSSGKSFRDRAAERFEIRKAARQTYRPFKRWFGSSGK